MTLLSIDYDQLACPISYTQKCHLANICTTLGVFKWGLRCNFAKGLVTWRLKLLVVKWMKFSIVMLIFLCLLQLKRNHNILDNTAHWQNGYTRGMRFHHLKWMSGGIDCSVVQLCSCDKIGIKNKGFVLSFRTAPIYLTSHTKGQKNNCERRPCLRVLRKNTYCDW